MLAASADPTLARLELDLVVCSHTLEDVRDPVWVCGEMIRIGRADHIEVPSRLEEQSYCFQGPWVEFVLKHHVIVGRESLLQLRGDARPWVGVPRRRLAGLARAAKRVRE